MFSLHQLWVYFSLTYVTMVLQSPLQCIFISRSDNSRQTCQHCEMENREKIFYPDKKIVKNRKQYEKSIILNIAYPVTPPCRLAKSSASKNSAAEVSFATIPWLTL